MKASAYKLSGECATVSAKIIFPRMGNLENLKFYTFYQKCAEVALTTQGALHSQKRGDFANQLFQ